MEWREARRAHLGELFHISPAAMSAAQQEAIVQAADAYALALAREVLDYEPPEHDAESMSIEQEDGSSITGWCCSWHMIASQIAEEDAGWRRRCAHD